MSDVISTINESMRQTDEAQRLCRQAIAACEILMERIKILKDENEQLKKRLNK